MGVVANLLNYNLIQGQIINEKIGETGYAFIVDSEGVALAHPNEDNIFTLNITKLAGMEELQSEMLSGNTGVRTYVFQEEEKNSRICPYLLHRLECCLEYN